MERFEFNYIIWWFAFYSWKEPENNQIVNEYFYDFKSIIERDYGMAFGFFG